MEEAIKLENGRFPEQVCGNIMLRPNELEFKGMKVDGHKHNFDHTTFVIKGSVHVKAVCPCGKEENNIEKDFSAGDWFLVKKDWSHEITALEDGVLFNCVYAHRDPQGRVIQENDGWLSGTPHDNPAVQKKYPEEYL